jgi:VWFA-related protein
MELRPARRSILLGIALCSGMTLQSAMGASPNISKLDLQSYLCPLKLQQPNNDPSAGVDFVTDNEVLVYTVCRVNTSLSQRDAAAPDASDPNHLKAVLLDLSSGAVIKSFDWPTRGRGAMVRVNHHGELLVQTDNLLRTISLEGKQIAAVRLVKVGQSDVTFVNSSPAVNSVAVIQSSEAQGRTVNGVAVLDDHGLEPLAQWHDDGESWNIVATPKTALRTQNNGSRLQIIELSKASDENTKENTSWKTVWSGSGGSRPVFLGGDRFAFAVGNSVSVFSAPSGADRIDLECTKALGVKASAKGNLLAAACMHYALQPSPSSLVRSTNVVSEIVDVYQVNPLRKLGSASLPPLDDDAFDFAVSPSAEEVAVVDQLHLSVYAVTADATVPAAIPSIAIATGNDNGTNENLPSLRTAARLVQIDTVVTNSQGHPVPDLAVNDFSLLVDGQPQKIATFSYESPEKTQEPLPPVPSKPGSFTNRPETRQSSSVVILLLDGLNTPSTQQLYVRQQMLKYLRDLQPSNARMAVFALGSDLAVLQDFTTDLTSLRAAVQNYKRGRTKDDIDVAPIDLPAAGGGGSGGASAPAGAKTGGDLPGVQDLLDFFSRTVVNEEQDTRVRTTIAALQAIAQSVAGYPGRKSLIWVSSSFPFTLGFDDSPISHFAFYKSYADDIHKTTALLTDANVAVYPVDAHGLLSTGGVADLTIPAASGAPSTDLSTEAFKNFRADETSNTVAQDTGGKVFRNTNDLSGAIKSAIADAESHYILGYYLDRNKLDGEFHTLRVKVAGKNLKARSRTGFFALNAEDWRRRQNSGIAPTALNGIAATGVLFEAHPTAPQSPGQPARIDISVDATTVSFGDGPNATHPVDLSFEVAALKPDGKLEHVETRSAAADVREETYLQFLKTGIPIPIEMPLPPGRYLLRITIRDNRSGHIGSLDLPLTIS